MLGDHTAKSLINTMYFYNGKLFGLRFKEHRGLRFCNFRVDSVSITYDESVSKNYHDGLNDIKYSPGVIKHVCCVGKETNHTRCIRKCYAKYLEKIKALAEKQEAFYFKPNLNEYEYYNMVLGVNTLNQILPNMCEKAGLCRKTSYCLRVTCAMRLFQSNVEEKLIRERTGHRSNALLAYEKKSDEQALKVSNVLGPQTATVNASTAEKERMQNIIDSDFSLFDFGVPDEVLANMPMPEVEVKQSENPGSALVSGCMFNNCSTNFGCRI